MKLFLLFLVLSISLNSYSQNTDSLINLIYKQKTDTARIRRMYDVFLSAGEIGPVKATEVHQQILALVRKNKDRVGEAIATAELGYTFANAGSTVQGTRLLLSAIKMAEETGNAQAMGIVYQNMGQSQTDPNKDKEWQQKALVYSARANDYLFLTYEYLHLAGYYSLRSTRKLDSALYYAEKGYAIARTKNIGATQSSLLTGLSQIHMLLGNNGLALAYIRTAEKLTNKKLVNQDDKTNIYNTYTYFFYTQKRPDSALFYAYKGLTSAKKSFISNWVGPAEALSALYEGKNADSALKYTKLYYAVKDTFNNIQKLQQVQALNFDEARRLETIKAAKDQEAEEHQQNLQYAAIAIGLVVFALLFLLFSHSIIATQNTIKYLGILSLLIVFEFINLLIHPYIGNLTHHSPILMLLFMVCLAALLIPMHHKLEHWITNKMVEKNKQIRLAAAKKTIAQLENEDAK
jgi:hypothetical protein